MGIRLGVLSTYPTTQCGIATFAEALVSHLTRAGASVGVVRVVDTPQPRLAPVTHQWVTGSDTGIEAAADALDSFDVAIVQHEYGIFGGPDGSDVVEVAQRVNVPIITVLHTVLTHPTPHQHSVLAGLCAASSVLVTMTTTARDRLISGWDVSPERVVVIPHGAEHNLPDLRVGLTGGTDDVTILTWGLLGEGKGIEWALLALSEMRDLLPSVTYRVVGQTHPRVLERDGEAYRDSLVALTRHLGLESTVRFESDYLPGPALRRIVRESDIVLLPYDSVEQVTSGVLTEAVAAGKPVVSTSFPHAVELLTGGAGLLVPQRDPEAIAHALRRVLQEDGLRSSMELRSRRLAGSLLWSTVAARYVALAAAQQQRVPSVA